MNFDALESGINDVYEYVDMHVRSVSDDGVASTDNIVVDRDLYSGTVVRPFLQGLSSRVTAAYQANQKALQQHQSQKTLLVCLAVGLIVLQVVAMGLLIKYVIQQFRKSAKVVPVNSANGMSVRTDVPGDRYKNVEMFGWAIIGTTVSLSFVSVLCTNCFTEIAKLNKDFSIDITKIPNAGLLWEPVIRQIYYLSIPNDDERANQIASDPGLSADCLDLGTADADPGLGTVSQDLCGRATLDLSAKLGSSGSVDIQTSIIKFYNNKAATAHMLLHQNTNGNVQLLRDAHSTLMSLVTDTGDDGDDGADPTDVRTQNVVETIVVPAITAAYATTTGAQVTGQVLSTLHASSSNDCIDQAIGNSQVKLAVYDSSSTSSNCTLYSSGAVVGSSSNNTAFAMGNHSYQMVPHTVSDGATLRTINLTPFKNLTDCISACDADDTCNVCYSADGSNYSVMQEVSENDEEYPLAFSCCNDCYAMKTPTNSNSSLAGRAAHLAQSLSHIYTVQSVDPKDVAVLTIDSLTNMGWNSNLLAQVQNILNQADTQYSVENKQSTQTLSDAKFLRKLSSMTRLSFVNTVLLPVDTLKNSTFTLRNYLTTQSDLIDMTWSNQNRWVNAVISIVVICSAVGFGLNILKKNGEGITWTYWLRLALGVGLVVFTCSLLKSSIDKTYKTNQAKKAARYTAGLRVVENANSLSDYLTQKADWVGNLFEMQSVSVDPQTGLVTADTSPLDLKNPVLLQRVNMDGTSQKVLAANLKQLILDVDASLVDCQDVLHLDPVKVFPWNEVILLVVGVVVVGAVWVFISSCLYPGVTLDKLTRLLHHKQIGDLHNVNLWEPVGAGQLAENVGLGVAVLVLLVTSGVCIYNAQEYQARVACKRKRP